MNIQIDTLSKRFGDVLALNRVSLDIRDGELFFLLGPSGCGKTTLLRCLAGFEHPDNGSIRMGGCEVTGQPANLRPTAMVFQGYALWPHLSVFDNIAFGLEMRKLDRQTIADRVERVMGQVQISHLARRKPNELSGGQQQRVALARTLVVEPGCLLLDEPLANLDAKLRRDMRLEIRRLCKESGLTAVYVTHDRQEALSMADRLAVLKEGIIVQAGTPTEIYRRPQSRFIAGFIGETNLIPGTLSERNESGGGVVQTGCGSFRAALVAEDIRPGSAVTLSLRPEAFRLRRETETPATENSLAVTLQQIDYLGELADHISQRDDGGTLKFFELNPRGEFSPGDRLRLSIAPDDVMVMND